MPTLTVGKWGRLKTTTKFQCKSTFLSCF